MSSKTPSDQTNLESADVELPPEVRIAVDISTKLQRALDAIVSPVWEYEVKECQRLPTEKLDVLAFMNELGSEGWEVFSDPMMGKREAGFAMADGQPLLYNVLQVFCRRRKQA